MPPVDVPEINPEEVEETADRMEKAMRKDRDLKEGEEDFSVQTPIQSLSTVNQILSVINIIVVGIAFMWEVFEHWVVQNIPNFPYAGSELFINKIVGDTISDLIGFLIAMLAIRSIRKSEK